MSKVKIPGSFRKHASFHLQLEFNLRQKQVLAPQTYEKTPFEKDKKTNPKAIYLLSSVNDILCQCQSIHTGPPSHWVMSRGRMSHFHRTELQEGLAQCYTTEEQLPVLKGKKDHEYTMLMTLNLEATLVSFHSSDISQVLFCWTKVTLTLESSSPRKG